MNSIITTITSMSFMQVYSLICIVVFLGFAWSYFMIRFGNRAPKVSELAQNVAGLVMRDFLRLYQGAHEQAHAHFSERFVGDAEMSELVGIGPEAVADKNSHSSGVRWEIQFNPKGISFITLIGDEDRADVGIVSDAAKLLRWKFSIATKYNVHISVV